MHSDERSMHARFDTPVPTPVPVGFKCPSLPPSLPSLTLGTGDKAGESRGRLSGPFGVEPMSRASDAVEVVAREPLRCRGNVRGTDVVRVAAT